MTDFGYHASREQFPLGMLVRYVRQAAEYGFTDVLASDSFRIWSERQGNAGHVWSRRGVAEILQTESDDVIAHRLTDDRDIVDVHSLTNDDRRDGGCQG